MMATMAGSAAAGTQSGVVKSYNGAKGFGFIASEAMDGDVFFGRADLPEDAREVNGKFLEGRQLSFVAVQQADGRMKATSVQLIAEDGQLLTGCIKNYSDKNGYGFIQSSCCDSDIRFERRLLNEVPPGSALIGKLVLFQMEALPDGKLRATTIQFQSGVTAKEMKFGGGPPGPWGTPPGPWGGPPGPWSGSGCGGGFAGGVVTPHMQRAMGMQPMQPQFGGAAVKGGAWTTPAPMHRGGGGGTVTGVVKSFSEKNGYGFINVPGQPVDIKFGKADLVGGPVDAGSTVRFNLVHGPNGRLAATQVSPGAAPSSAKGGSWGVKRPAAAMGAYVANGGPPKVLKGGGKGGGAKSGPVEVEATGQWVSGTIKSFNPTKGFGFISSPGVDGDVFFMRSDLPQEVQQGIQQGAVVSYELMSTLEGKLRAQSIVLG